MFQSKQAVEKTTKISKSCKRKEERKKEKQSGHFQTSPCSKDS